MTYVHDLADITADDSGSAGSKGANLGELIATGFSVPGGFFISGDGYWAAMDLSGVRTGIALLHAEALGCVKDARQLADSCERLKALVRKAGLTTGIRDALLAAYREMGPSVAVAVRSSATGEDGTASSFAGMNSSYTNVWGEDAVADRVLDCWASQFSPRALTYRARRGFTDEPGMAVVVQRMVGADRSGVVFTADPRTGDRDRVLIEAVFGQGEALVSGAVDPDTYVVAKKGLELVSVRVGTKDRKIVASVGGGDVAVALPAQAARRRVLDDVTVLELARLATRVEDHYRRPQDIEFALVDRKIWLVQARPVTALPPLGKPAPETLATGLPASPGKARGAVRVLHDPRWAGYLRQGEVLVTPEAGPEWIPAIARAAAVVTDVGGLTSHAAVIARELGVPCVVGTGDATTVLADRRLVTVDGDNGEVRPAGTRTPPGGFAGTFDDLLAGPVPSISGSGL
jgi:pyruvate,water dikinase